MYNYILYSYVCMLDQYLYIRSRCVKLYPCNVVCAANLTCKFDHTNALWYLFGLAAVKLWKSVQICSFWSAETDCDLDCIDRAAKIALQVGCPLLWCYWLRVRWHFIFCMLFQSVEANGQHFGIYRQNIKGSIWQTLIILTMSASNISCWWSLQDNTKN